MSNFINNFIEAAKGMDFRKIDDLVIGLPYKVLSFSTKNTSFGTALLGEMEDPETEGTFFCYFPDRLAKQIKNEDQIQELNNQGFYVIFKGRENKAATLDFVKNIVNLS